MDYSALKKALRKTLKARRMAIPPEEIREKSALIFRHWKVFFDLKSIRKIHVFLSITQFHEVETSFFTEYILGSCPWISTVVPVMGEGSDLIHVEMGSDLEMVENSFGIREPRMRQRVVNPEEIDMVLVPLLGFDMTGGRIGYGKGMYDRFLRETRPDCVKIGLGFECCRVMEGLPLEPTDFPLDFVVTEAGVEKMSQP